MTSAVYNGCNEMNKSINQYMYIYLFQVKVDIEKGSGYFHIVEGRPGIVDLKFAEKKKQLQVGVSVRTLSLCKNIESL